MAGIAEAAGLSAATAYRHFSSVDEVLAAYRFEIGHRLFNFSERQQAVGLELLRAVCAEWVRLVVRHGGSMVQMRSAEGYLARMRDGTCYLTVQAEALRRPLEEASRELGTQLPGDEALFLWNAFFDPREVFDLIHTVGLDHEQASRRLLLTYTAALRGWSDGRT